MWISLRVGFIVGSLVALGWCVSYGAAQQPTGRPAVVTKLGSDGSVLCGNGDTPPAAMAAWPASCAGKLKLCVNPAGLAGLSSADFLDAAAESLRNCSAVSGLAITLTPDKAAADIYLAAEAMRSGILAYCEFPADTCSQQVQTRFNSRVQWSRPLFIDTLTHELGHGFGLPHTQDRRDIMFPTLLPDRGLDGKFGPHYSIPQMVARYGDFRPQPEAPNIPPLPPLPIPSWLAGLLQWLVNVLAVLASGVAVGRYVVPCDSGRPTVCQGNRLDSGPSSE